MADTTADQQMDEVLEGGLDRSNYRGLAASIYSSFNSVDQAHEQLKELLSELEEASGARERDLHERAGILSYLLGDYSRAEEHLREVESRKEASYFLGRVYMEMQRMDAAEEALQKGREGEEDFQTDVLMVDIHCHRRDSEAAREICEAYRQERSEDPDWLYAMGRVLDTEGRYGEAIQHYERALEQDPEHRKALFRLALNHDLNGEDDRARELYERCATLQPSSLSALINLGVLYEDQGRYDRAAECYQRVLAMDPAHPRARLYLKDAEASRHMVVDEEQRRRQRAHQKVLDIPISTFELSARSRTVLEELGVTTLGGLAARSEEELLEFNNFGETSLEEMRRLLQRHNLGLGSEAPASERGMDSGLSDVQSEEMLETLETPVEELELSTRCRKCMERLDIQTLGELIELTEKDLLDTPNIGQTSVNEIKTRLAEYGLSLSEE